MPAYITPIYEPEARFTTWRMEEIYTGPTGVGMFVPNINDLVVSIVNAVVTWYVVTDLNYGTYLSTLTPVSPASTAGLTPYDIALGIGPGAGNQTHRLYIDKRTVPYSLDVDARLQIYGSSAVSCKIFVGVDLSATGRVISAQYDNGGQYLGENLPLELVATDAYTNNLAIKTVVPGKTSANLLDGEVVTLVVYSLNGSVVDKQQLLVENTAFIRSANANAKTVVGVGLQSPFLASGSAKNIVYPRNIALQAENLTGLVYYSDGSEMALPVDGTRFSVAGLDSFDSSSVGVSFPLVAMYELSSNEQAYGGVGGARTVSETYTVTTATANLDYEVRLFPYLKWVDTNSGYRLTWWLFDAARSLAQDVTEMVSLTVDSAAFLPKAYGIKQTLKAMVDLAQVGGNYNTYIHTQEVDVKLQAQGTFRQNLSTPPNWYVTPVAGTTPLFGGGVYATYTIVSGNTKTVKVMGNFYTLQAWLQAYYWNTQPLVLEPGEVTAPIPTHFTLVINGAEFQYAIEAWNTVLTLTAAASNNDTVYIRFQYAGQTMLELSCAGMPLYQLNNNGSYV